MIRGAAGALLAVTFLPGGLAPAAAADPVPSAASTLAAVRAFVDRAIGHVAEVGREAALADFTDPAGPFHDGELYIYAYDQDGTVIAHGGDPSLVGRNLIALLDPDGLPVIASLARLARQGGGWLAYRWPNPATGEEAARKIGYVRPVDETWFLGSGVYGDAAEPSGEDEARDFLAAALAALAALPREELLARVADPTSPHAAGHLRVLVSDRAGTLLADPAAPELVGRPVLALPGPDGTPRIDALLRSATDPGAPPVALVEMAAVDGFAIVPRRAVAALATDELIVVVTYPDPAPAG